MGTSAPAPTSRSQHQHPPHSNAAASPSHAELSDGGILLTPHQHPSLSDLRSVAEDIKDTLTAAISDLKIEIQAITGRIQAVEQTTALHSSKIRHQNLAIDTHTRQLRDVNRHLEDLDNRGRRHNLRLRGLPETVDADHLQSEVIHIFNNILGRPREVPIAMERIHRALRPKGKDSDPPRDVVCCIIDYRLKEDILRAARSLTPLLHNGTELRLFQDLSNITLQRRRELQPLLTVLRAKGIIYRWKFPFGLAATVQGRSALLRVPEDLHSFCDTLGIPLMEVPDWYAEFRTPTASKAPSRSEAMETQHTSYRRHRSPSEPRIHQPDPQSPSIYSPTKPPRSRRARRDR